MNAIAMPVGCYVAGSAGEQEYGSSHSTWSDVDSAILSCRFLLVDTDAIAASTGDSAIAQDTFFALATGKPVSLVSRLSVPTSQAFLWCRRIRAYWGYAQSLEQAAWLTGIILDHDAPMKIMGSPSTPRWAAEIEKAESPIEVRLGLHLLQEFEMDADVRFQQTVECGDRSFRLDFAITDPEDDSIKLAIEADGHEFHERTKEQAARDKARDRALQLAGWRLLRFTGSEIWRDAHKCALETVKHIDTLRAERR